MPGRARERERLRLRYRDDPEYRARCVARNAELRLRYRDDPEYRARTLERYRRWYHADPVRREEIRARRRAEYHRRRRLRSQDHP